MDIVLEMSKLKIDVSDLKGEGEALIKELASFLAEKTQSTVKVRGNHLIIEAERKPTLNDMRKLLKDFLRKANVEGKVKARKSTLTIIKSRGKPIFCDGNGVWKKELEERLLKGEEVVLLSLGDVKLQVLAYLNMRKEIEIIRMETRYMKKREKGMGLKIIIKKRQQVG